VATEIISNGSTWLGEDPASVEELLQVLGKWQLDRERFEDCFIETMEDGRTKFFGNFLRISHVFRIITDDAQTIDQLTQAITANYGISYDPVEAFTLCIVSPEHALAGHWVNRNDGTFERVSADRKGEFSVRSGVFVDVHSMQAIANAGMVKTY